MKKQKHVLFRFLRYAFRCHKPYFFILLLSILVQSAITLYGASHLSIIIYFLEAGVYNKAILSGFILVGIEVLLNLGKNFIQNLEHIHQIKLQEALSQEVSKKIMSIPFSYLENPYYLQLKSNADMGIKNMGAIYRLVGGLSKLASSILSLIGLMTILAVFDIWLVLILIGGVVLNVLVVLLSIKAQSRFHKELVPINFKYDYYINTLLNTNNSKDFRFYNIKNLLMIHFKSLGKEVNKTLKGYMMRTGLIASCSQTIGYIVMGIVYLFVGIKTFTKKLSISSFSLTVSAAISFSDAIRSIINAFEDFTIAIDLISPMVEILSLTEETIGQKKLEHLKTIEFEHVYFKYPNTNQYVLNDVSFVIESGQKISIVGLNGAGKTTIIKLLCRLYKVTKGRILVNGISIEEYDQESYIEKLSTVFQDYKLFSYSILENIHPKGKEEAIKEICKDIGIASKIEELPNQYQSILSKSYDEKGVELSGGQMQKIAIARAIAKNADLLILDEPTSALDPLAEAEIYENFNSIVHNKTAIYISHRMSSSIFCDKILVLEDGKVASFDTHQNLMSQKGSLYYKLFTSQAQNYKLNCS